MKTVSVSVETISIPERHRRFDPVKVEALAESMGRLGLMQPISVWIHENGDDFDVTLVAGRHRLEAAKSLGWPEIEAIEVTLGEVDRELWEIDENLIRSELTTDEKREHLRRRKELWDQAQAERAENAAAESGASCATLPKTGRGNKQFAADTAEKTGMSKSQINRLLANPKPRASTKQTVDDRGEPNMVEVAERLANKYTAGQLQEIIDHLSDVIKGRMECDR